MAFSNFHAGGGGSGASTLEYALRLMIRDVHDRFASARQIDSEREQREREHSQQRLPDANDGPDAKASRRVKGEAAPREKSESSAHALDELEEEKDKGTLAYWLGKDSPLFLHNVPDHVIDTDRAVREIAVRHLGEKKAQEMAPSHFASLDKSAQGQEAGRSIVTTQELHANLITFAEVMDEKINRASRRGRPDGDWRTYYDWLNSPGKDIPNRAYKEILREVVKEFEPRMIVAGYSHGDTAHLHGHYWISASLAGQKGKLHIGKVPDPRDPDGKWLNKDIGESFIKRVGDYLKDPKVYEEYVAKKAETHEAMARVKVALKDGERPPALPYRARFDYDNLGEARYRAKRRRAIAIGEDPGPPRKAPPVPRNASALESARLFGKMIYGEQLAECRREVLNSFVAMRGQFRPLLVGEHLSLTDVAKERTEIGERALKSPTGHEVFNAQDQRRLDHLDKAEVLLHKSLAEETTHLQKELAEAVQYYREHQSAYEKTIANRQHDGRSEIKYPVHDTRQLEEMRDLAEQTRSARWLAYVHQYEVLDQPSDPDKLGRVIAARLRDHVMAVTEVELQARNLSVIERGSRALLLVERDEGGRDHVIPAGDKLRREYRIIAGWLGGGWTLDEMRGSLTLMQDEMVRSYAERYLKTCEYLHETEKILSEYREDASDIRVAPALRIDHTLDDIADINSLLAKKDALTNNITREMLQTAIRVSEKVTQPTRAEFELMVVEQPLPQRSYDLNREEQFEVLRPHDDKWVERLLAAQEIAYARVRTLALRGARRREWSAALESSKSLREAVELTNEIRAQAGKSAINAKAFTRDETRELSKLKRSLLKRLGLEPQWDREQIERIQSVLHNFSIAEREKLAPMIERSQQRLAQFERGAELKRDIEMVRTSFSEAASKYLAEVRQPGGSQRMPDPQQIIEHTARLGEIYRSTILELGFTQEQLGLGDEEITRLSHSVYMDAAAMPEPYRQELGETGERDTLPTDVALVERETEHIEAQLMLATGRELVAFAEYRVGRASAEVEKHYDHARGMELHLEADLLEKVYEGARIETSLLYREYRVQYGSDVKFPPAALTQTQHKHLTNLLDEIRDRDQEARSRISYELQKAIDLPFHDPASRLGQVEEFAHIQLHERQEQLALRLEKGYGAASFEFTDGADLGTRDHEF